MNETKNRSLIPALRELLDCWDEELLSVWVDTQLHVDWHCHVDSRVVWPMPGLRPS